VFHFLDNTEFEVISEGVNIAVEISVTLALNSN
jgi:hypothetical protein